jgi:hypothetical protein
MEVGGHIHCDNLTHEGRASGTNGQQAWRGPHGVWMRWLQRLNYPDQNNLGYNSVKEHFIAVSNEG